MNGMSCLILKNSMSYSLLYPLSRERERARERV
jgi:hypothetical protein